MGVTSISRDVYGLHMMAFWVCVVIGILVFGVMIWSIIFHRRSRGAVADVTLVHNTKVEIIWTAVPVLILVGMAIPAARGIVLIGDDANSQLEIKVTGFQWGWQYTYPGKGVSFVSKLDEKSMAASDLDSGISPYSVPHYLRNVDHPLVVPVGTKVRLLITAVDVIHSWWVPDFGIKKDAIPGYINQSWFEVDADKPGVYRGQCAELCGRGHGYMPIVVDAVSKADFAGLGEARGSRGESRRRRQRVFELRRRNQSRLTFQTGPKSFREGRSHGRDAAHRSPRARRSRS